MTDLTKPDALTSGLAASLAALRDKRPLVHNITNYVVMNTTANALLAIGASPVMAHAIDEVAEFARMASSVVINIGTLSGPWVEAMDQAATTATESGTPWVLDPVGVGATAMRRAAGEDLVRHRPAVVRGNASEIIALAGLAESAGQGVDATDSVDDAARAARNLSNATGAAVAVTGPVDFVVHGDRAVTIHNGHPLMAQVTGMGCTSSALVGAWLGTVDDPFEAAVFTLAALGVAGQLAAEKAAGPGSFQVALLDVLAALTPEQLSTHAQIRAVGGESS